jgi:hypothetical protein
MNAKCQKHGLKLIYLFIFVYVKNPGKDDKGEEDKDKEHPIMNAFGDYMGWQGQFFHVTCCSMPLFIWVPSQVRTFFFDETSLFFGSTLRFFVNVEVSVIFDLRLIVKEIFAGIHGLLFYRT